MRPVLTCFSTRISQLSAHGQHKHAYAKLLTPVEQQRFPPALRPSLRWVMPTRTLKVMATNR